MRLLPDIKGKYDSLVATLDTKMWVKGTYAGGKVSSVDNNGAWGYQVGADDYGVTCQGVCAVGAIDMYLGAGAVNQDVMHYDPDQDIDIVSGLKNQPVTDRLLDWYDSTLIVAGKHYADLVFVQWAKHYFTPELLREREEADTWGEANILLMSDVQEWDSIPAMNDHPATKLEDVQDMMGAIDKYRPFKAISRLRQEPILKRLDKANHLYDKWVRPYLDTTGAGTQTVRPYQYIAWLKDANIL